MTTTNTQTTTIFARKPGCSYDVYGRPDRSLRERVIAPPTEIRLNLDTAPSLPKKYGKKIKAVGGRYDSARGNAGSRQVCLPLKARELADKLATEYYCSGYSYAARKQVGMTVSLHGTLTHESAVYHIPKADSADAVKKTLKLFWVRHAKAAKEGRILKVTEADMVADETERAEVKRVKRLERLAVAAENLIKEAEELGVSNAYVEATLGKLAEEARSAK